MFWDTGLTYVDLPDSLKSIGIDAFNQCRNLTSIDFPDGLIEIQRGAFGRCDSLTSIHLPDSLESIGFGAFEGCTALTSVIMPACLSNVEGQPFSGCTSLVALVDNGQYDLSSTFPDSSFGLVVLLRQGVEACNLSGLNIENDAEVYVFGDSYTGTLDCDKVYSFLDKEDLPSGNYEYVRLGVDSLNFNRVYNGRSLLLNFNITGSPWLKIKPMNSAIDAGYYIVENVPLSIHNEKYGIDVSEFDVHLDEPLTYTISKAPLNVFVSPSSASITYGEPCPDFKVEYDGFVNGENETVLSSLPVAEYPVDEYPDAGTYPVTVSGGAARNYEMKYVDAELTVDKAVLTVTGESYVVTYGDDLPQFEYAIDGFVKGDDVSNLDAMPQAFFFSKYPIAGEHVLTIEGGVSDNYDFKYKPGILTVNKAKLVATGKSYNITYGDSRPDFEVMYDGFVRSDDKSVLSSLPVVECPAGEYPNAGTYPITISGGEAHNYDIECVDGELVVGRAGLTVQVHGGYNYITYGERRPDFDLWYFGFVNGDNESDLTSLPVVECDAGEYPDVGVYNVTVSGGEASNYEFNYVNAQLYVEAAELTVYGGNYAITYGDPRPDIELVYSGFANGDDVSVLTSPPIAWCSAGEYPDAGTYTVMVSGGYARNYNLCLIDGELSVSKVDLEVSAKSYAITYGDELPEFEYDIKGFVNGDDESDLEALPVVACSAGSYPDAGSYTLSIYGGEARNYDFDYRPGTLTVLKAAQTIDWPQDFTSGLSQGDMVEITATATSGLGITYESTNVDVAEVIHIDGRPYLNCVNDGSANIIATQPGDRNHEAAPSVTRRVNVGHGSGLAPSASSPSVGCRPSPARDVLEVTGTDASMTAAVYSPSGAMVLSSRCADGMTRLDVSRLDAGTYILVVSGGDGATARLRFAKE